MAGMLHLTDILKLVINQFNNRSLKYNRAIKLQGISSINLV